MDRAGNIARDFLGPSAAEVDSSGKFPEQGVRALAETGLLGLCLPRDFDGGGEGPRTFAAVVEELAAECASTAMVYVMHVTASQQIVASTTLADKDEALREIASGRHLTTLSFSEAGSRSQFWAPVSKLT